MNSQHPKKSLQHEEKMSMKDRIEQSRAYGEEFRAANAGADQREAVKPLANEKTIDRPLVSNNNNNNNNEDEEDSEENL